MEKFVRIDVWGATGNCRITAPLGSDRDSKQSQDGSVTFASFDFFPLTFPSTSPKTLHPNEYALAHLDPSKQPSYVGKYHGYGVIMPGELGYQKELRWMCRAHMLKIDFSLKGANKKVPSEQLWSFAEPAISEVCGLADRPSTPAFNENYYRIDHTKLYMKDWRLLSDNPRRKPPEKLSYQQP